MPRKRTTRLTERDASALADAYAVLATGHRNGCDCPDCGEVRATEYGRFVGRVINVR